MEPASTFEQDSVFIQLVICLSFVLFRKCLIVLCRKVLAGVLQALHLTPGRRLLACLEKLLSCPKIPSKTAPMHPLVGQILHFLKGEGQSTSSLQDLAASVGCVPDEDDLKVTSNVDLIMQHLVHAMLSCSDYKVRDMGHRQELKFIVEKKVYGCPHKPSDEIIKHSEYAVTLQLKNFRGRNLSAVQNALDNSLKTSSTHTCDQCSQDNMMKSKIAIRMKRHIYPFCDPDFLTISFDIPRNLLESDLILQCGESIYAVKVVTHWDKVRQKSSVSVQRSDGWWWHGTDMEQASQYKYREKQKSFCNPFSNAIVLMCVRIVPYANFEESDEDMEEGLLDVEDREEEMDTEDKDGGNIEAVGMCNILGGDQDSRRNDGLGCEGSRDPNLLYDYEAALVESIMLAGEAGGVEVNDTLMEYEGEQNGKDLIEEENLNREQSINLGSSDQPLLYDYEAALVESRQANPNLKTQAEMVDFGIQSMRSFGVACLRPDNYTPLDGDCLWTCFIKSRDPSLVGNALRAEVFHHRVRCVGAAKEEIKSMDEERLAMVQSVIAKVGVPAQSREEIIAHLTRYMERGIWDGMMGDLLPYVAASFSNQGLLIVNLDTRSITYAAPECKMFHGREDFKFPCIVVRQFNHFEEVPIKHDSKEVASALFDMLKNGEHLTLPAEVGDINDRQFEPELTSTLQTGGTRLSRQNKEGHGNSEEGASRSLFGEQHEHVQSSLASTAEEQMETQRSQVQQNGLFHCNCGFNGAVAIHLRSNNQCVQSLREELSIRAEISDEVLTIQVTLLFGGCPAPGCNGGSHEEIPDLCLSWWIDSGWNLMQWQGAHSELKSADIHEATKEFVKEAKSFQDQNLEERSTLADHVSILLKLNENFAQ